MFVQLGFKIDGPEVLPQVEKQLESAAGKAGKLALGLDVITAGLGFMADMATTTAVGLHKFALSTGLSTQELQRWQHAGVVSNVTAKEMTETITNLQSVHSKMMLQGGNSAAPWLMLGISPSEKDPFKMMEVLTKAMSGIDKSKLPFARTIMENAGFGPDMFQFFRRPDALELVKSLGDMYILTDRDQKKLTDLNKKWEDLRDRAKDVSNIFMSEMSPAQERVLNLLLRIVDKLAEFTTYLQSHAEVRRFFEVMVVGVGGAAVAVTALAAALKGLALAMGALQLVSSPFLLTIGGIAAAFAALALAVPTVVSAMKHFNDPDTSKGGYDPSTPDGRLRARSNRKPPNLGGPLGHSWLTYSVADLFDLAPNWGPRDHGRNVSPIMLRIEKILIDGSRDPQATGRAVVDSLRREMTYAGSQAPAPNL